MRIKHSDPERFHHALINKTATADAIEEQRDFIRLHPLPKGQAKFKRTWSNYRQGQFAGFGGTKEQQ